MDTKHYVVIGGTRGIGKIIVEHISRAGHKVSVLGRNAVSNQKQGLIQYFTGDITDTKTTSKTLAKIVKTRGKISHLIFCQRFRGDKDNWQSELDTSLTVTKNIIDDVTDSFDDSPEKSIVVLSSIAGVFISGDQSLGYHVVKAGLNQLVRYYAVTLGPLGIRINSVSPAAVIKSEAHEFYLKHASLHNAFKKIIPLGRMGTPEDIYGVVSFFTSNASLYVTGQNIIVDGGFSLIAHEGLIRKMVIEKNTI
jgi:3-oxoacyl-[acyl-carrier protein] reductase